jgi:hypothetical protein
MEGVVEVSDSSDFFESCSSESCSSVNVVPNQDDAEFQEYIDKLNNASSAKLAYLQQKRMFQKFLDNEFKTIVLRRDQMQKALNACKKEYKLTDSEFRKISSKITSTPK